MPRPDVAHQLDQAGHVVDVLQHLAGRLEGDRERGELAGHRQQLGGALPLLPQRRAPARVAPGEQQRAGGALAEPAGEQRRAADLGGHLALDVVRVEDGEVGLRRLAGGVGQPQHDAVVGVHRGDVHAVALAQPGRQHERPRRVDLGAEGGVDDQPPVAQLVAEALDQQRPVVGQVAGGRLLLGEVGLQVGRAPLVEPGRPGPLEPGLRGGRPDLAQEGAERPAQLQRPARGVAVPERHLAGLPGRRA